MLDYYIPKTVLKLRVLDLCSIIFVEKHIDNSKEYRAYIEHNNVFISSDENLENLKIKVQDYLLCTFKKIEKEIKN